MGNAYRIFVGVPQGKKPHGSPLDVDGMIITK
jgi:hypothetical protein